MRRFSKTSAVNLSEAGLIPLCYLFPLCIHFKMNINLRKSLPEHTSDTPWYRAVPSMVFLQFSSNVITPNLFLNGSPSLDAAITVFSVSHQFQITVYEVLRPCRYFELLCCSTQKILITMRCWERKRLICFHCCWWAPGLFLVVCGLCREHGDAGPSPGRPAWARLLTCPPWLRYWLLAN